MPQPRFTDKEVALIGRLAMNAQATGPMVGLVAAIQVKCKEHFESLDLEVLEAVNKELAEQPRDFLTTAIEAAKKKAEKKGD